MPVSIKRRFLLSLAGFILIVGLVPGMAQAKRTIAESPALDIYTELDAISINVLNYFKGVSNSVFGIKSRVYANNGSTDIFSGYFAASSDSSVRNSYGVFGLSSPDGAVKSVGVRGEAYGSEANSIGVEGIGGNIGILGEAPFGGIAVKAKQHSSGGYAIFAEGGKNYFENKIEIGSAANPQGIILYDHDSGLPYCLRVVNTALELESGDCSN